MGEQKPERRAPCPICGRPGSPDYRPFCAKRCADVDLARWLGGVYAIPAGGPDDDEDGEDADDRRPDGMSEPLSS